MIESFILKSMRDKTLYDKEKWIEVYPKYLRNLYGSSVCMRRSPYRDPDEFAKHNILFYVRLEEFLNMREREMENQLNGKWHYRFINGETSNEYGIHVSDENGNKLFVLFSDQFGFSAPTNDKKYPYDYYAELAKDDLEKAISNIAVWIYESRSIGGSFLWPRHNKDQSNYNQARGGSKNSVNYSRYYIEDRVDLTLLEIKHIFDEKKTETDILYPYWNRCEELKIFFDHFGSFKTYIEFFMMDDLVKGDMPIDIITGETMTDEDIKKYRNKKVSIFDLEIDRLEQMLRRVNDLIVARSNKIQG